MPENTKTFSEESLISGFADIEKRKWLEENIHAYRELMTYYRCAMMEVSTKFQVLSEELSLQYDRNPIESIKTRLKTPESTLEKLHRKGYSLSAENIEAHIRDIAGVRVICSYPADIYMLADAFLKQDDITLLVTKDYIANPKESGYRSLHLIVETPIFLLERKKRMKVEVQFRTMSMDWWASLEHKICYKKDLQLNEPILSELNECARISADLDRRMERLQMIVSGMRSLSQDKS